MQIRCLANKPWTCSSLPTSCNRELDDPLNNQLPLPHSRRRIIYNCIVVSDRHIIAQCGWFKLSPVNQTMPVNGRWFNASLVGLASLRDGIQLQGILDVFDLPRRRPADTRHELALSIRHPLKRGYDEN